MTSAPKSARVCVQAGPATTRVKSTTSSPSRAVGASFARGKRSGSGTLVVMVGHSLVILIWTGGLYGLFLPNHKGTTGPVLPPTHTKHDVNSISAIKKARWLSATGQEFWLEAVPRNGRPQPAPNPHLLHIVPSIRSSALELFPPIKRVGPTPRALRIKELVARFDEIIGGR